MFRIAPTRLNPDALRRELPAGRAGGFVSFEGRVRDRNGGRAVRALEYEAYAELAAKEGARILAEARRKFAVTAVAGAHRVGRLRVGEIAVWVGVTAAHRGAAFDACRYIIDELKSRVPIWKKEHYATGASQWIGSGSGRPRPALKERRKRTGQSQSARVRPPGE
jgi:molybdopterin synthase catalytic subunit